MLKDYKLMPAVLILIIFLLSSCKFSSTSLEASQRNRKVSQIQFDQNEFSTVFQFGDDVIELGSTRVEDLTDMSLNTIKAWSGFTDDVIQDRLDRFHYIDIEREHSEVNAYFEADQENISKLEVVISRDVFWKHADEFEESIDFRKNKSETSK